MKADPRAAYLDLLEKSEASIPPAGFDYLLHLIRRTAFQGEGYRNLGPAELFSAFRRSAAADFGPFLEASLDRLGIRNGNDLGKAVFLLASRGCLTLGAGESPADYAALGSLGAEP